ncbi:30S ribosomal protein S6 [candidate division Kazan bacterium]|uniref:Small ribosomal subunit protein bS6 n=1 Tax=candidate division Kazan bacterium TaxID=2202143 RepID=A0A420ZBD2_UNCK3|nr:MAG: 30S ribosomal protein S6 [candidate division Kazan bacterium]
MEEKKPTNLTNYEITFIVAPDVTDLEVQKLVTKIHDSITKKGGNIFSNDIWGKQRLAYPIQKHEFGHYITTVFTLPPQFSDTLIAELRLMPEVLRYLLISLDKEKIKPGELKRIEPFKEQYTPRTTATSAARTKTPRGTSVSRDKTPVAATPKKDEATRMKELDKKLEDILKEE